MSGHEVILQTIALFVMADESHLSGNCNYAFDGLFNGDVSYVCNSVN